jgi:hypothetical protein
MSPSVHHALLLKAKPTAFQQQNCPLFAGSVSRLFVRHRRKDRHTPCARYPQEMLRMSVRMPYTSVNSIKEMFVHQSLNSCVDSLSQVNDSSSECDNSVDFGTLFEDRKRLNPRCSECSEYSSSNGSIHQCYLTERTKHIASQSTCSNRTFCKKRRLELLEFDTISPSASLRPENLEDQERVESLGVKHIYAGREILNRWILLTVRTSF